MGEQPKVMALPTPTVSETSRALVLSHLPASPGLAETQGCGRRRVG